MKNQNILFAGLAGIGVAIAVNEYRKRQGSNASKGNEPKSVDSLSERDEKIDFIISNAASNEAEEMSGFNGNRYAFNPRLGYPLPKGSVDVENSGRSMDIDAERNYAHEIHFNADGDTNGNPVTEAIDMLEKLSDDDLDIAYKATKVRLNKANASLKEVADEIGLSDDQKKTYAEIVVPVVKDLKALKKSPSWESNFGKRRKYLRSRAKTRKQNREAKRKGRPTPFNRGRSDNGRTAPFGKMKNPCKGKGLNKLEYIECLKKHNMLPNGNYHAEQPENRTSPLGSQQYRNN